MGEDRSILQLGGLGGMVGGILLLLGILLGAVLAGPAVSPEEQIVQYPDRGAGPRAFASIAFVAALLIITLFLALNRALRRTSPALALWGSVLGVLGLVFLTVSAANTLVTYPFLSGLYHAPGTTADERTTLVLLWRYTFEGIFQAVFLAQTVFVSIGILTLGLAMLAAPGFGRVFGGVSVVLGAIGVAGAALGRLVAGTEFVYIIVAIIFPLLLGWKVYGMARPTTTS